VLDSDLRVQRSSHNWK